MWAEATDPNSTVIGNVCPPLPLLLLVVDGPAWSSSAVVVYPSPLICAIFLREKRVWFDGSFCPFSAFALQAPSDTHPSPQSHSSKANRTRPQNTQIALL